MHPNPNVRDIIVPLDRSDLSEVALLPARWLAKGFDADVRLITTTFGSDADEDFAYLRACGNAVGMDNVTPEIVLDRFPVQGILDVTDSLPSAVLCMATRGQGVTPRTLGGVADEVVRRITAPVVLVGPSFIGEPFPHGSSLVVPLDGSVASASILPTAASWAVALRLDVHVVTVRTSRERGCPRAMVDRAVKDLEQEGVRAVGLHAMGDDIPAELLTVAADVNASLFALSPTGHGGAMNRALGYVATDIVGRSPIPVLVRRQR